MAASSVSGIGSGAAYGQKGPGNKRDQTVPLSAPHVIAAGIATVPAGGTLVVSLPYALSVKTGLNQVVVLVQAVGSSTAAYASSLTDVDDTQSGLYPNLYNGFKTFTLNMSGGGTVQWTVILVGQGIDEIQPTFVGPSPVQPVYQYNEPN